MKRDKSVLKYVKDFTAIDVETTGRGIDPREITEISAVKYRDGVAVTELSFLVKAESPILPYVVSLTGITDEMLRDAPNISRVIREFVAFLNDDIIVGHNVAFDYGLVRDAYKEYCGANLENECVDTLRIARLLGLSVDNHRLSTLCEHFNIHCDVSHRALEDSRQTAELYLKLQEMYMDKLKGIKE